MASVQGKQKDSEGLYRQDAEGGKANTEHHQQPSQSGLKQGVRQALASHDMATGPEKKQTAQGVSCQHLGHAEIDSGSIYHERQRGRGL